MIHFFAIKPLSKAFGKFSPDVTIWPRKRKEDYAISMDKVCLPWAMLQFEIKLAKKREEFVSHFDESNHIFIQPILCLRNFSVQYLESYPMLQGRLTDDQAYELWKIIAEVSQHLEECEKYPNHIVPGDNIMHIGLERHKSIFKRKHSQHLKKVLIG